MRQILLSAALLGSACGGRVSSAPAEPVGSSTQVMTDFLRAARDSSLTRMAELWGTARGPASQTRPAGYEKRVAVMQVYLRGDSTRVVSDEPVPGDESHRRIQLALYRGTCVKQLPATMVRAKKRWLVSSVDLSQAGNPARPCE